MTISLEQLSAQMRRGEQVPLRHTMQVVLTLSIPSILHGTPMRSALQRSSHSALKESKKSAACKQILPISLGLSRG